MTLSRKELLARVEGARGHHVDYLIEQGRFVPVPYLDMSHRRHYREAHVGQLRRYVEAVGRKRAKRDARRALKSETLR